MISHLVIPPKILTKRTSTLGSESTKITAVLIRSDEAPPPKSRKLAGFPPLRVTVSIVAIVNPAPLPIMPILPFIVEDELEEIVKAAKKYKADYILYKHLELKGDQKAVFLKEIGKINPSLLDKYKKLYKDNYIPNQGYILNIGDILEQYCVKYNLRNRV